MPWNFRISEFQNFICHSHRRRLWAGVQRFCQAEAYEERGEMSVSSLIRRGGNLVSVE